MKKWFGPIFVLALAVSCSSVKNATVDYAHDFDFADVKTFSYLDTPDSNPPNQLLADRIEDLIKRELIDGGLTEVDTDPDIVVTYHVTAEDRTSYNTTSVGYGGYGGWGPGWGGYGRYGYGYPGMGMTTSTTYETTYTDGTLIIDAFDPETKKLVWRGTGTVTVKDDPQARSGQVEKILDAIGSKWEKILAGQGK